MAGAPADMNGLYARLVRAIREVDEETPIVVDCGVYATPWAMAGLLPIDDPRVFGVDRRSPGAALYLADLVRIFEAEGWHWAFYAFREDTWDAMDYELGDGPLPAGYWAAVEAGRTPALPRHGSPLFDVLKQALARRGAAPSSR